MALFHRASFVGTQAALFMSSSNYKTGMSVNQARHPNPMTHPIITKKRKEFDKAFRYFAGKPFRASLELTHNNVRPFLTQAIEEAYEAGKKDEFWTWVHENDFVRRTQRETAKEILAMMADRQTRMVQPLYQIDPTAPPSLEDLISSKYLSEDSPKNETA